MSSSDKLKIPLQEISSATNGFAESNIIGKGGYGLVYRGKSEQHGMLAIKRLNRVHGQGDHEYGMEVTLLSKYRHKNLVSLIGFCGEDGEKILVYKYEPNQSLDKFLHRKDLSWIRRLQICLGAARGLRYLHNETGSEHEVIHRDIKCSNILLDENWNAKISDFGLSKIALTNSADSVMFTAPCGTFGYLDPEYLQDGALTQKSDVYSFGVVLFEVLFGKLVNYFPKLMQDCHFTVDMAKKHYEDETLHTLIDPDIRTQMNSASLSTFSSIAYDCLKNFRKDRPTMSSVVETLEKALAYQQVNGFELSSSEYMYDVYISFRIELAFVIDGLCDSLKREGLSTYKDGYKDFYYDQEKPRWPAIKQSRSFIIFFSKNSGADSSNLNEVVDIMECVKERGNVMIPVFWDVSPSDVREQKGFFGEPMSEFVFEKILEALVEATDVPGLGKSDFNRFSYNPYPETAAKIKRMLLGE